MGRPAGSEKQRKSLKCLWQQPCEVCVRAGSVRFEVLPLSVNNFLIQKANRVFLLEKLKWSISRKRRFLTFKAVTSRAE